GVCRAAWVPWPETARLAHLAAGLLVGGAAEVTRRDLDALRRGGIGSARKVVTAARAEALAEGYRRRGQRVALTNGCFDLLHAGHLACGEGAAREAAGLFVAVNADDSVRRLKGPGRPAVAQDDRAALVAALGCVGHVVLWGEDTPHRLLTRLRPDVLVK